MKSQRFTMMNCPSSFTSVVVFFAVMLGMAGSPVAQKVKSSPAPDWAFNATIMEACSCPMFCQCYFNTKPAAHHSAQGKVEHFCLFNIAFKVNKGYYGDVKLKGAKFWTSGNAGEDFSEGKLDWVVVTFDPSVSSEQRAAIQTIVGYLMPVEWNSFAVAKDAKLEWKVTKEGAEAKLNGGKVAEIVLRPLQGMNDEPVVIKNVKWFGVPRNDGFVLMPNEVEAYRVGDKAFEFKGTNGFMVTLDMTSKDLN